ncbi:MAG: prepilin-type N-terminal cleavage/methylation domain-containing protein [Thermodesulforhabdaceae bacterium]
MLLALLSAKKLRLPKGFTLMEVVIAITVGAMVMGILSVALSLSVRTWEQSKKPLKNELDDLMELFSTQIIFLNQSPLPYRGGNAPLFLGKKNEIFFATNFSPIGRSMNCPVMVHYRFDEEKQTLTYRQVIIPGNIPEGSTLIDDFIAMQENAEALITIPSVRAFNLKYFEQIDGQALEKWDKPGSIPFKILVEVQTSEGEKMLVRSSYPNLFGNLSPASTHQTPTKSGKK